MHLAVLQKSHPTLNRRLCLQRESRPVGSTNGKGRGRKDAHRPMRGLTRLVVPYTAGDKHVHHLDESLPVVDRLPLVAEDSLDPVNYR